MTNSDGMKLWLALTLASAIVGCGRFGYQSLSREDAGADLSTMADTSVDAPVDAGLETGVDLGADGGTDLGTPGVPAFVVTPEVGLTTTEAGAEATFTVRLATLPTDNVFVILESSNTSEATVSPASLVFTPVNGLSARTVTVTGVNDFLTDGNQAFTITTTNLSSAGDYVGLDIADVTGTNLDDETAGIVVSPTSGLITSESGGTATFTVVLQSEPSSNVVIPLVSPDTDEVAVSPASVTFTPLNWDSAQVATVRGVDDAIADGPQTATVHVGPATSAAPDYDGMSGSDVSITNTDNDSPGLVVSPAGSFVTTEIGGTATFTLALRTQPTASVTIDVSSENLAEGTASPGTLTFTTVNWMVPRTITVTGVDDLVTDGDRSYTILLHVNATADTDYAALSDVRVLVSNIDNETPGITVTPTSGLVTSELGATDTFTIVLNAQPTDDVTLTLASSSSGEGSVSPASATFTSANWNMPQAFLVSGVDDSAADGDRAYLIVTSAAASSDTDYNLLNVSDIGVTNLDNEVAGVTVTPISGLVTTETGGSATFDVVLNVAPSADVSIDFASSNPTEGSASPATLTFTTSNWNVPQTVTVTGADDFVDDSDTGYSIVTSATMSASAAYDGIPVADVSVTNTDNDVASIVVMPTSGLTTTEAGGTAVFSVVLTSEPTSNLHIDYTVTDLTEGTVSGTGLEFDSSNWNVPQTITITGVDDAFDDGNKTYTVAASATFTGDASYIALVASDVSVTNTDDDTASVVVQQTGTTTSENGGSVTIWFTFTCAFETSDGYSVNISDTTEGIMPGGAGGFGSSIPAGFAAFTTAVTLVGQDDLLVDGDQVYSVDFAVTGSDPGYAGTPPIHVMLTNLDNDSGSIIVSPTAGVAVTDKASSATFRVVLGHVPTGNVTVGLTSDDLTEATVSPASLTFTSGNWSTPRTVTVTGVADAIVDGDQVATIVTAPATSSDGSYNNVNAPDVSVTCIDSEAGRVVSARPDYTPGDAEEIWPNCISTDGRYVAFASSDGALVAGDTNGTVDVFRRDRLLGAAVRTSVTNAGAQASGLNPAMSADGRYVEFNSNLSTVVAGDTNGAYDVFVRDLVMGTTQRASVTSTGAEIADSSGWGMVSQTGRFVTFTTRANGVVPEDTNGSDDVYVRDMVANTTIRASVRTGGAQGGPVGSFEGQVSADGRYVAFASYDALEPTDTFATIDVYFRDTVADVTKRISQPRVGGVRYGNTSPPVMTPDGRYVAFDTDTQISPLDTNAYRDVYVWDRVTDTTTLVSVSSGGAIGNAYSNQVSISDDGQRIAFASSASNLVGDDINYSRDAFVRDRAAGTTTLISRTPSGAVAGTGIYNTGLGNFGAVGISGDGHTAIFVSYSFDMMPPGYFSGNGRRMFAVTLP